MRDDDDLMLVDDEDENTQDHKYLLFRLGDEVYGVAISHVINIIELQKITEVPDMPDYIRGVINLRGSVIPVMDLRLRFGLGARDYDDRTCIIIVKVESRTVGFIVDTVAEVVEIAADRIEPPLEFKKAGQDSRYIMGLGKVGDDVRILVDCLQILNDQNLNAA